MEVGFIGTGLMGSRMARCLMDAGHHLTVYDLYRENAADLETKGARWAESPRAVAHAAGPVITSLTGPDEVEEVFFDSQKGILAGLHAGSCYMDTSTNSPALWKRIAAACKAKGAEVLDTPVTGRAPQMTIMAGGDAATLEKYKPLLLAMSQAVYHMGGDSMGMVAKGVHQYLLHAKFLLLAEVMLVGVKGGIEVDNLAELLSHVGAGSGMPWDTFKSIVFPRKWERVPEGPGPVFRWIKDVGCAGETARDFKIDMPILAAVEGVLADAKKEGWGDLVNFTDVRVLEQLAGVELETSTWK